MTWSAKASPAWRGQRPYDRGGILGAELEFEASRAAALRYVPERAPHSNSQGPNSTVANQYRLEPAATRLNLELVVFTARNADKVRRALDSIAAADVRAVNVLASPMLNGARRFIIDRLRNNRLPSIHEWPETADDGGLLGYGSTILYALSTRRSPS